MSILCTICARGGSKGVKNKNTRTLLGKPLIAHSIEQARSSGLFAHIVVSTDSDEIAEAAERAGAAAWFRRPADLATDSAPKLPAMRHALLEAEKHYKERYDFTVDLDATSPLRLPEDIRQAFDQFKRDGNQVLFSATNARRSPYFNLVEVDENGRVRLSKTPEKPLARRQDSPKCYDMNASVYVFTRQALLTASSLFTDHTGIYLMPEDRSIDIDSEFDFEIVEFLLRRRIERGEM